MQIRVNSYSFLGLVTSSQFRLRQGGTPFRLLPFCCRERNQGRRRERTRALPRALRLPRETSSPSLVSGYTVILLNVFYNRDGPAESAAPNS